VIRYTGLLQYPRKIIQLRETLSEHADCVDDVPVDTDVHTATSRGYLEVIPDVLLLHRHADRGANLVRELFKQRLGTRDSGISASSSVGVIASVDERLHARALELIVGPRAVNEQRGRASRRVERRSVERQVLLEFYTSIKVALATKQSTTRVHVLEVQVLERDQWVGTLKLLQSTLVSVERRDLALILSTLYLVTTRWR